MEITVQPHSRAVDRRFAEYWRSATAVRDSDIAIRDLEASVRRLEDVEDVLNDLPRPTASNNAVTRDNRQ